jgi:hypothetical protein
MTAWRRLAMAAVGVLSATLPAVGQCGLAVAPAAETRWYRSDGWAIPGLEDAKFRPLHVVVDGKQRDWHWADGVTVSVSLPDDNHRHLTIPGAVFDDNGSSKKLLEQSAYLYRIFRWEFKGRPYAYSYDLGSEHTGCGFSFDLIDDRGDGKFRLMASPGHSVMDRLPGAEPEPPPLPSWAVKPSS